MRRMIGCILCSLSAMTFGCGSDDGSAVGPALDLTGHWVGTAPNGALYEDNVANPNCRYEADLALDFVQSEGTVSGVLDLTVRKSEKLLSTSVPCVPVGTRSVQSLFGEVGSTQVNFTLGDEVTVFSGTFTTDILGGEFVVNSVNGVIGTWTVNRS